MNFDIKAGIQWRLKRIENICYKHFQKFILFVDNKINKSANIWAFPVCYLNHQLFDNARPIFEKLRNENQILKIVLYRSERPNLKGKNVKLIKLYSISGIYYLLKSKVVFVRHCVKQDIGFSINNDKRLVVNLWHGLPLKKIGVQNIPNSITGIDQLNAIISCAPTDKKIMRDSFIYANDNNVWLTGFPRNDVLMAKEETLWPEAKKEIDLIKSRLNGRKLILFAPTYRASWESWSNSGNFYKFNENELQKLSQIAKENNAVIGIRTHLREERTVIEAFKGLEVIVFNDIVETGLVLKMTDILITDYSSLAFDFLLTGRPLLSFAFDYELYKQGRGFLYTLEQVFPSEICYEFDTLLAELNNIFSKDNINHLAVKHTQITNFFHTYQDSEATNRVIQKIHHALKS